MSTQPNIDLRNGTHYGAISGNSLDPELLDLLYQKASASVSDRLRAEREQELRRALSNLFDRVDDFIIFSECGAVIDTQLDEEAEAGWFHDEPEADIEHEGVHLHFGWLGGAPLLLITDSPFAVTVNSLCSPCVPNAGDLDSGVDESGQGRLTYTVPPDWLREDN